jgi:hypothetical protein
MSYEVRQEITEDFNLCWKTAGSHLSKQSDILFWINASLKGLLLEHFSFRLGNQIFFIQIEDVDNNLACPGQREAFLEKAKSWNAHALIMPMKKVGVKWNPLHPNWGLEDALTEKLVIPTALITDKEIEITDNELHDIAIQVVTNQLVKEGKTITSSQNNSKINPSIFFVDKKGKQSWVIVRGERWPRTTIRPIDIEEIAKSPQLVDHSGYFASVTVASPKDAFNPNPKSGHNTPLLRGEQYKIMYRGLESLLND